MRGCSTWICRCRNRCRCNFDVAENLHRHARDLRASSRPAKSGQQNDAGEHLPDHDRVHAGALDETQGRVVDRPVDVVLQHREGRETREADQNTDRPIPARRDHTADQHRAREDRRVATADGQACAHPMQIFVAVLPQRRPTVHEGDQDIADSVDRRKDKKERTQPPSADGADRQDSAAEEQRGLLVEGRVHQDRAGGPFGYAQGADVVPRVAVGRHGGRRESLEDDVYECGRDPQHGNSDEQAPGSRHCHNRRAACDDACATQGPRSRLG